MQTNKLVLFFKLINYVPGFREAYLVNYTKTFIGESSYSMLHVIL